MSNHNHNQLNVAINVDCNLIIYFAPRKNERNKVVQMFNAPRTLHQIIPFQGVPPIIPCFFNHRHQLRKKNAAITRLLSSFIQVASPDHDHLIFNKKLEQKREKQWYLSNKNWVHLSLSTFAIIRKTFYDILLFTNKIQTF